jgi:hypothetical protein
VTSAGYSGTPLPTKLGIKAGHRVALVGAPADFEVTLGALPGGVALRKQLRGPLDVLVYFTRDAADLASKVERLGAAIEVDGALWVAWPKRASKVPTDITENVVRDLALPLGLVDNKVAALDETWSGLRLVWRRELRADLKAARGG